MWRGLVIAGEVEQVGDQLVELAGLFACRSDEDGGLRVGQPVAVLKQVEVCGETGQRCTQFVRGVRDQLTLRRYGVVQRGQHRVERRAEAAHLVGSGGAEASGEVSRLGDVFGRRGELADRAQDAPGRQPGKTVGDARGRDREPGEQQGGVAQRSVIGVRARLVRTRAPPSAPGMAAV